MSEQPVPTTAIVDYLRREAHEADQAVIRLTGKVARAQVDLEMIEGQLADARQEAERLHSEVAQALAEPLIGTLVNNDGSARAGLAEGQG